MAGATGGVAAGAGAAGRAGGPRGTGAADGADSFAALLQGPSAGSAPRGGGARTDAGARSESSAPASPDADAAATSTSPATADAASEPAASGDVTNQDGAADGDIATQREANPQAPATSGVRAQARQARAEAARAPVDGESPGDIDPVHPSAADEAASDAVSDPASNPTPDPVVATNPPAVSAEALRSLEWIVGALSGGTAASAANGEPASPEADAALAPTEPLRGSLQAVLRQAAALSGREASRSSPTTDFTIDPPAMPSPDHTAMGDAGAGVQADATASVPVDFARSIEQMAAALRADGAAPVPTVDSAALSAMAAANAPATPAATHAALPPTPQAPLLPFANPLLLDHPDGVADLGERIVWQLDAEVSEASIELHPAELGHLTVRIETRGDQAQVQFVAQEAATRNLLNQAMPQLRELLSSNGLQLTRSQVDGARRGGDAELRGTAAGTLSPTDGTRRRVTRVTLVDAYV